MTVRMARSLLTVAICIAFLSIAIGYIYNSWLTTLARPITVLGVLRDPVPIAQFTDENITLIEGTTHCEDIHYHAPSHKLYTACEDSGNTRFAWFPPLALFDCSVVNQARGGLFVIEPETKKARKLEFENFPGPFITHGIDVISDPEERPGDAVYIFAVNHLPNPDLYILGPQGCSRKLQLGSPPPPKARSQIEIFHHKVGTSKARHIRSVWDPLITTPNDLVALSPKQFLVTNDHFYREGLMRSVEDIYPGAKWTNTIHVELSNLSAAQPTSGVRTTVALDSVHNNNGLGHGRHMNEILVASAAGGTLHVGELSAAGTGNPTIDIVEVIHLQSTIDNPSYFADPFANSTFDASGFVLAGLGRAIDLPKTIRDPLARDAVMVWYTRQAEVGWESEMIFEDDGSTIRSASASVMVGIDPTKENGKRRAWLYVTGFLSANVVAIKVDL
ncbi:hypothetical protein BJ170DRAFT_631146 [Xylariales sp. AK1849]|nr:hypothetical protein BJ170DRAFT_631146 [Xylariales sp. AK1849]